MKYSILGIVESAPYSPVDSELSPLKPSASTLSPDEGTLRDGQAAQSPGISLLLHELWQNAHAEKAGLSVLEFSAVLESIGLKVNFGLPPGSTANAAQRAAFFRALHLEELALAHACALGREVAWEQFMARFRGQLVQAATAITRSSGLGADLADGLYAELYGMHERDGERKCPLASYSGRGSLLGWLRTTLVQRYRDHYRRTCRETPLEDIDAPAPKDASSSGTEPALLAEAVSDVLARLPAEDRFLLAAYFLDRQTLLQIARTLRVHEATVSRRLKRLAEDLRKKLLRDLRFRGLSQAAAEEALGADPRDVEINLRALLQTSQRPSFSGRRGTPDTGAPESL